MKMANYEREDLVKGSLDVWRRRKEIYERHLAGEDYESIAGDLNITKSRAASLACDWGRILRFRHMMSRRTIRLINAGLLDGKKRSPEYGYA